MAGFFMQYKTPNLYTVLGATQKHSRLGLLICLIKKIGNITNNKNIRNVYVAAIAYSILIDKYHKHKYDADLANGGGQEIEFTLEQVFAALDHIRNIQSYLQSLLICIFCGFILFIGSLIMAGDDTVYAICSMFVIDSCGLLTNNIQIFPFYLFDNHH
jgi:hypothetical protein